MDKFKKYKEYIIEANWDSKRKACIISKEDYEDWDEISPVVFESLYLSNADENLKKKAMEILSSWYEEERCTYNNRYDFLNFVKSTIHNKIINCKSIETMNILWQVIDETQIDFNDNFTESFMNSNCEDFDSKWDKEFGEYMDGIQVMKAEDAINLLKRMERFE